MIDEFILYEDLRIGPNFFISNRAKIFFVISGDGPEFTFRYYMNALMIQIDNDRILAATCEGIPLASGHVSTSPA
ncbi:hypothetical protein Hanom_Chr07g00600831 [Helianthus anomalus]